MPSTPKIRLTTKHLSHHKNFLQVNVLLIKELNGDGNAAILLTAIEWWTNFEGYEHPDGHTWWEASHEKLAQRTGFSVDKVRKLVAKLRGLGVIEQTKHHRTGGTTNHTLSYRIVLDDGEVDAPEPQNPANPADPADRPDRSGGSADSDVADRPDLDVADRPDLPLYREQMGGEGRSASTPTPQPPLPHQCSRHQDGENDDPCHGCRRAREALEAEREAAARRRAANPTTRCPIHGTMYAVGGYCSGCSSEHKVDPKAHPQHVPQCSRCSEG